MSENKDISSSPASGILRLDQYRRGGTKRDSSANSPRVSIEVACADPIGSQIKSLLAEQLNRIGCVVVDSEDAGWVYSVIGMPHGTSVELSIILRQTFHSTSPGTEVKDQNAEGTVSLRQGSWVYESLRFHGLFGVPQCDLENFLANLAGEFGLTHYKQRLRGNKST